MTDSQTPPPTVAAWTAWASADAERRGLPALAPLLEGLAAATARLRAVAWQPAADAPEPEGPPGSMGATDGR